MNTRAHPTLLRAALAALGAIACSADVLPTVTHVAVVRVIVVASGTDLDLDGYTITLDGSPTATADSRGGTRNLLVPPGSHGVALAGVSANCTVEGGATAQVSVAPRDTAIVQFAVSCASVTLTVAISTTGTDSPTSYRLVVDAGPPLIVAVNDAYAVGRLSPGPHSLTLLVPTHCTVAGGNQVVADVSDRRPTDVAFAVACRPVDRQELIAYVEYDIDDTPVIETITPDGQQRRRSSLHGFEVTWTGDGTRLVVSDAACDFDSFNIMKLEYCYGGLRLFDLELGVERFIFEGALGFSPAWSPARDEVAFSRATLATPLDDAAPSGLVIADQPSQRARGLPMVDSGGMYAPTWSPDGNRLAFICGSWPGNADLCVIDRDGTNSRRLTSDAIMDGNPAWSPDGRTIAFERYANGGSPLDGLALLDVATGAITLLGPGAQPAWSPDGSRIVYVDNGLVVMNADGSNRVRLTSGRHGSPAWRPATPSASASSAGVRGAQP